MNNKAAAGSGVFSEVKTLRPQVLRALAFWTYFLVALNVNAASYYVATTGSDGSTCTQARSTSTPKRTISNAAGCLVAGDTLFVRGGTYAERITSVPSGTSWNNAVIISAYQSEVVTVAPGTEVVTLNSPIQYVIFQNLIFNAAGANGGVVIYLGNPVNHVRFQNCDVKGAHQSGVQIAELSTFNEFIGGKYHDNGINGLPPPNATYGFYIVGSNNLIDGAEIYNNPGFGVHMYRSSAPYPSNNIVRNSRVYGNGFAYDPSSGIIITHGVGNAAYNNLIYNNIRGLSVSYGDSGSKVYNNTIYGNTYEAIEVNGSVNPTIKNNIMYQNGGTIVNYGSSIVTSNNLTTDPKFVNPSTFDFRLQSTSAAINAGTTLSEVTTDAGGVSRPQGGAYDIGAFEYESGSTSTLPAPSNLNVAP